MFNGEREQRARVCGGRQLRRLPPADARGVRRPRAAPQHAADVGQLGQRRPAAAADGLLLPRGRAGWRGQQSTGPATRRRSSFCTPSGNFGNLTAGLMAKRAGLPIARFVAATNANDVVPAYLETGRFEPRPSVQTIANAMDVGHPSNFERMLWLYGGELDAMRRDVAGCRFSDDEVRTTIQRVYEDARLPARSAQCDRVHGTEQGRKGRSGGKRQDGSAGVFLSTGASGEVRRDRRADHRTRRREAAGARGRAQRTAAHHPHPCLARSRPRHARRVSRGDALPVPRRRSRPVTAARHPSDRTHAATAGPRLRPRFVQGTRFACSANAISGVNFPRSSTRAASTISGGAIPSSRCSRGSSSSRSTASPSKRVRPRIRRGWLR